MVQIISLFQIQNTATQSCQVTCPMSHSCQEELRFESSYSGFRVYALNHQVLLFKFICLHFLKFSTQLIDPSFLKHFVLWFSMSLCVAPYQSFFAVSLFQIHVQTVLSLLFAGNLAMVIWFSLWLECVSAARISSLSSIS